MLIEIDDPHDPRLEAYHNVKHTNLTRASGRFIAEGWRVVKRLIDSPFEVESILLSERRRDFLLEELGTPCPVYIVPQKMGEGLVGFNFHTGVLACGLRQIRYQRERDFWQRLTPNGVVAICPRITSPDNLGSLIRLCRCFDVAGIILGPDSTDPFIRRVIRVSMGYTFHLPILEADNLGRVCSKLQNDFDYEFVGMELSPDAQPLMSAKRKRGVAVFFGNEADGLEQQWLDMCGQQVYVPMSPGVDSLNVTHSAGIVLYHFTRCCDGDETSPTETPHVAPDDD